MQEKGSEEKPEGRTKTFRRKTSSSLSSNGVRNGTMTLTAVAFGDCDHRASQSRGCYPIRYEAKKGVDWLTQLFSFAQGASFSPSKVCVNSIVLYTIEHSCRTTKALFSEDEWGEITEQSSFDMPELSSSIVRYLDS